MKIKGVWAAQRNNMCLLRNMTRSLSMSTNTGSSSLADGDGRAFIEALMPKMHELAKTSNIEFLSEQEDVLKPVVLYNDGKIIRSDDLVFSTEQMLRLLCIPSNLKAEPETLINMYEDLFEHKSFEDTVLGEEMVAWIDKYRVPLTVENAKQMSGVLEEDHEDYKELNLDWVAFMKQTFSDCCIIRVPASDSMELSLDPSSYCYDVWYEHDNFILGRTPQGHLAGFCGYVVWAV